jgi:hypothetical protein
MNRVFSISLSILTIVILLFGFQTTFVSCTKTSTTDTVTITKIDTLTKTDTLSTSDTAITIQLLTSTPWKLLYLRGVSDDTIVYYTRGGQYNENFDAQLITFNANMTGAFIDGNSGNHTFTWNWSNSSNTQLTWVATNNPPFPTETFVWDDLRYRNDSLLFNQYSTFEGNNSQVECILVPQSH